MKPRIISTYAQIVAGAVILSMQMSAHAQDALGSGNALDRNTQVGSGGRNSQRPANPYAARNSVVTGEVIGGREFRGRIGYTAPGDFRGSLGSNDLYRFRADSAWSGAAGYRMSTSTYDQLRFGQGLGVLELNRSGSGATLNTVLQAPGPVSFSQLAESRLRYDNEMLTATSASRITGAPESTLLGTGLTTDGKEVAIVASSVRGLTLDQYNQRWDSMGLSIYDQIRMREDAAKGITGPAGAERGAGREEAQPRPGAAEGDRVGEAFQTRFDDLRTESAAGADAKVDATAGADYSRLLQNIADRYARSGNRDVAVDPSILKTLNDQYQGLKNQLMGQPPGDAGPKQTVDPGTGQPLPTAAPSEQAPTASPTPGRPDLINPADPRNRTPTPPTPADQPGTDTAEKPFDYSELAPALRHGEKIASLSSRQQGRFNELMMAAEEQLKKGEYMIAEQRFQRAMRFSPGNPLAMAGAANAQIGAGLYLPAGYTLRSLYTQHPEMIDATYGEGLLPSDDRVSAAIDAINVRLEAGTDRASHALVLAYLGRQRSDAALMERGLKIMTESSADDPLPALLRTVWLEGGAAPSPKPEPEK